MKVSESETEVIVELFIDAGELIFSVCQSTGEIKTEGELCKMEIV